MLTLCEVRNSKVRHYRGISTDVVAGGNCYNVPRENGDEIYTMDTQKVYLFDEESGKWRDQEGGTEV